MLISGDCVFFVVFFVGVLVSLGATTSPKSASSPLFSDGLTNKQFFSNFESLSSELLWSKLKSLSKALGIINVLHLISLE